MAEHDVPDPMETLARNVVQLARERGWEMGLPPADILRIVDPSLSRQIDERIADLDDATLKYVALADVLDELNDIGHHRLAAKIRARRPLTAEEGAELDAAMEALQKRRKGEA